MMGQKINILRAMIQSLTVKSLETRLRRCLVEMEHLSNSAKKKQPLPKFRSIIVLSE